MQKLKDAKLYKGELVSLNTPLVNRYNQCLKLIGIAPTALTQISVDGIGWSPEVAEEKGNLYYLNIGEANTNAIIISPEQHRKPVYFPFHSFDKDIMYGIFAAHKKAITDITRDGAICVDLDQFIDAFYHPLDLLKYKTISTGFRILNDLDKKQEEQLELIETFYEGNNFIDDQMHIKLLASARKNGDLRQRKLKLTPLTYQTTSFYTKAFGGVFVLRDFIQTILIFEDDKNYKEAIKDTEQDVLIYKITDDELLDKLIDHSIITSDIEDEAKTERYARIKKFVLSRYLTHTDHPIKDILEDHILFKSYLHKINELDRNTVLCVDKFVAKSASVTETTKDQKQFFKALAKPHSSLQDEHLTLIWKLLLKIAPLDIVNLYYFEKELFYDHYKNWDASLKDWAIATIKEDLKNHSL
ncbi:MAG: hypothetical protein CL817_05980 [Croceibacter sp.]|nr:hypothetical protein [Croceibacter sp.]